MARGFKTGGRKKGTPNKRTTELRRIMEEVARDFDLCPPEEDSVDWLDALRKNPKLPLEVRIDIAKTVAKYQRPQLASTEVKDTTPQRFVIRKPEGAHSMEEWIALFRRFNGDGPLPPAHAVLPMKVTMDEWARLYPSSPDMNPPTPEKEGNA